MDFPRYHRPDEDVVIARGTHRATDTLAPSDEQAELGLYCFALKSVTHGQVPVGLMTTPTLLEEAVTDTVGDRSLFTRDCHSLIARGRNHQLKRTDQLFDIRCPDECVIRDAAHAIEQLAAMYCRPVELGLVEDLHHWEGAMLTPDAWGKPLTVARPTALSRPRTRLPEKVTIIPMPPAVLRARYSIEDARVLVNARIASLQAELNATRLQRTGSSRVLGRRGCRKLQPLAQRDPRRLPKRPDYVGTDAELALDDLRDFRRFYAQCCEVFRTIDRNVVFPAGTVRYRHLGAVCDPHPPATTPPPEFHFPDELPFEQSPRPPTAP